jgi:hypothetical protein
LLTWWKRAALLTAAGRVAAGCAQKKSHEGKLAAAENQKHVKMTKFSTKNQRQKIRGKKTKNDKKKNPSLVAFFG